MPSEFGALSLIPPLLAIALAIVTRRALLSLFLGIWIGGVIYVSDFAGADGIDLLTSAAVALGLGVVQAFDWVVAAVGEDTFHAKIIIFTFLLGAGIALVWRAGGSLAVTHFATEDVELDSYRKVGVATWLFGLVWFFDDYANTAIVGSAMKDIADEVRISREKFAYILDSTAAPVATFGISSWVAYQISLINQSMNGAGVPQDAASPVGIFLRSVPYNVYCLFALLMVLLVVLTRRDFGEMLDAEERARRTGKVVRDGAQPLQSIKEDLGEVQTETVLLRVFVVPVALLVAVVVSGAVLTGYAPGRDALAMAENADFTGALVWGSFAMVASAIVLALVHDLMSLDEAMETVVDGFGLMLHAVSILVLAWSIGAVAEALGTGDYVTGLAEGVVTPTLLPVVILFAAAFISFSIGTSWGTMALVTPVAIPMAWNISGGSTEMLAVATGAVFSGSIFGDHCSPISDTTILSSTFAGADHIDHVRTQLYYAVTVVAVAVVVYLLYGLTHLGPVVLLPVGALTLAALVYVLSSADARRKGLPAKPATVRPSETTSDD